MRSSIERFGYFLDNIMFRSPTTGLDAKFRKKIGIAPKKSVLPDYVVSDFLCRLRGQNVARFWLMSDVVFVSFLRFLWRFYVVFDIFQFYCTN